jgi:outer membrane protein assembly factor BamE
MPRMPSVDVPSIALPTVPVKPYTLDIQQGTAVDQKMIDRLSVGMTRNQVSLILGTPLLTDVMHADRWDYVYYTRKQGDIGEWRRFTCFFKDDRLATIEGDVTLSAAAKAPAVAAPAQAAVPDSGLPAPLPGASGPQQSGPKK